MHFGALHGFPIGRVTGGGFRAPGREVSGGAFAHDAANRFLNREAFSGNEVPQKFGFVTVFRTVDKNHAVRHYAQYDPRKKSA